MLSSRPAHTCHLSPYLDTSWAMRGQACRSTFPPRRSTSHSAAPTWLATTSIEKLGRRLSASPLSPTMTVSRSDPESHPNPVRAVTPVGWPPHDLLSCFL